MKYNSFHPYELEWGEITAEGYDRAKEDILLIFNMDLVNEMNFINAIQYVVGRVVYGAKNFPDNTRIRMTFDIRGQNLILARSGKFKNELMKRFTKLNLQEKISIDFLR